MTAYTPTDEQLSALTMAMTGDSFKIVAYAGAGKTTTLKLISENLRGRGLYLAFNKSIANEAQGKFPKPFTHSLTAMYHGILLPK